MLITAAHCTDGKSLTDICVRFASLPSDSQCYPVKDGKEPIDGYLRFKIMPNMDVALLRLNAPLPSTLEPSVLLPFGSLSDLSDNDEAAVVGHSHDGDEAETFLTRILKVRIQRVVDNAHALGLIFVNGASDEGIHKGDSGGPLYVKKNETWYLAGVASGPAQPRFAPDLVTSSPRGGTTAYSAIANYKKWIEASAGVKLPGATPERSFQFTPQEYKGTNFLESCGSNSIGIQHWLDYEMLLKEFCQSCEEIAQYISEDPRLPMLLTLPSLAPLTHFSHLNEIHLESVRGDWLQGIENLPNLEVLEINCVGPVDLKGVPLLRKLKKLSLVKCGLGSIDALGSLKNLEYLSLSGSTFADDAVFETLSQQGLKKLSLFLSKFKETGALSKLSAATQVMR